MATGGCRRWPIFVAEEWRQAGHQLPVTSPASGEVVGLTSAAATAEYQFAVTATARALKAQAGKKKVVRPDD